jgi:hypothetical protein
MRSALCDAVARCHARRLGKTVAAAPLPAALVAMFVALAPLALLRVGRAVGEELADVVGTGGVANALVLGPVLAATVAGAVLAVSLPGRSALGQQIAAGPCSDRTAIVAGLLVPALVGALAVLPSLVAACVALARQLPGGQTAGVALAVAAIAAVPAGAIVAEGALAAARGRRRRSLVIAGGALAWGVTGAALGVAPLGPLAPVGAALRGSGSAWLALAAACGAASALALAWATLAATRPESRVRRSRPARRLVRGGRFAAPAAVAVLLLRRDDVRLATAGALGFGAAGIGIAAASAAPAPAPFLLATTTALLGSILCSLAVCGLVLNGRWLWLGGPGDRRAIGLAACLVGLTGSSAPVAVVGTCAMVVSGTSWGAVGVVAAVVIVGSATALLAGALVPWSSAGVGDQLTTFAALAAIAIATSLAVGLVAPRLVSLGLPDALVVVLVCGASMGAALHAVGRRLGAAA